MRTHATSHIGETGLKIFNGFLIFFNGFPIFLNGFPIFLNGFLLSEKSKKIYLRQEVYKRSLFELCIFCHSLSHSCSELRNTRYNTQQSVAIEIITSILLFLFRRKSSLILFKSSSICFGHSNLSLVASFVGRLLAHANSPLSSCTM
jgi:hypothetical protein